MVQDAEEDHDDQNIAENQQRIFLMITQLLKVQVIYNRRVS